MENVKVGVVGCGNISDIYFQNIAKYDMLDIVACTDLIEERAEEKAEEYDVNACSPDEIYEKPEIDLILNLTTPQSHAEVLLKGIENGKHVYTEKPLAVDLDDGKKILKSAESKGVLVGTAPDTFLGGRLQTCRKVLDDGWIGKPIAATAFMTCHGHEMWHPDPEFFYKEGAGPMFDMGPYYLTALVSLLGPVDRVSGATEISFDERLITSEKKAGKKVEVEIPTHIAGTMEFDQGTIGTIITSFDVWDSHLPRLEIYGSKGTLSIADVDPLAGPNVFGGEVLLRTEKTADWNGLPTELPRKEARTEWDKVPVMFDYNENSRGVGFADMACAVQSGRAHRANGEMGYHVLELMHGFHVASDNGEYYELESTCERPAPLPEDLPEYTLDK